MAGIDGSLVVSNPTDLAQANTGKEKLLPDTLNRNDGDWHPEWLGGGKVDVRFKGWDANGKAVYQMKGASSVVEFHTNSYEKAANRAAELVRNKALTPRSGELGVSAPLLKPKVTQLSKVTTPLSTKLGKSPVQKTTNQKTKTPSPNIKLSAAELKIKRDAPSTQIDIPTQLRQSGVYTASGSEFSQLIGNKMGQDPNISAVMTGPNALRDIALIPKVPTNFGDFGNTAFKGGVNSVATFSSFAVAKKYFGVTPDRIVKNISLGAGVTVPFTTWAVDSFRTANPDTILGSKEKPKNTGDAAKQGFGNAVAVGSGVGVPALVSSLIELKKDPAMTVGKVFFNTGLAAVVPGIQSFGATVSTSDPRLTNGVGSATVGIGTNLVSLNVADKAIRAFATIKGTPVPPAKNILVNPSKAVLIEGSTEAAQVASYMIDLESKDVDLRNTETCKQLLEKIDYVLKAPIGLVGKGIDGLSGRGKPDNNQASQDWGQRIQQRFATFFSGSNTIGGKNFEKHYQDYKETIYRFHPELRPKS